MLDDALDEEEYCLSPDVVLNTASFYGKIETIEDVCVLASHHVCHNKLHINHTFYHNVPGAFFYRPIIPIHA